MNPLTKSKATALSLLCILGLAACGSNDKEVTIKSNGMTQTFSEGTNTNTQEFPFPIYPAAKPMGEVQATDGGDGKTKIFKMSNAEGNGQDEDNSKFLMLSSADAVDKISNFYTSKLKEDGWTVAPTFSQGTLVNLGATKKDLEASVMISGGDGGNSTISISVSKVMKGTPKATEQVFTPDKLNPPTD